MYLEDLKQGPTQRPVRLWRIGPKDIFDMASNRWILPTPSPETHNSKTLYSPTRPAT